MREFYNFSRGTTPGKKCNYPRLQKIFKQITGVTSNEKPEYAQDAAEVV